MADFEKILRKILKTGKVYLGSKRTIKALKKGEAKLVVIASNCPREFQEKIKKFSVPVLVFQGTNMELGAICGKPFSVASLAVIEEGDADISSFIEK